MKASALGFGALSDLELSVYFVQAPWLFDLPDAIGLLVLSQEDGQHALGFADWVELSAALAFG